MSGKVTVVHVVRPSPWPLSLLGYTTPGPILVYVVGSTVTATAGTNSSAGLNIHSANDDTSNGAATTTSRIRATLLTSIDRSLRKTTSCDKESLDVEDIKKVSDEKTSTLAKHLEHVDNSTSSVPSARN